MKLFRLIQQQQLPGSIETAWDFFSTPENLDKLTPPDMEFKILTGAGQRAFEGQIITYRIKPIFNIPMHWVTEITHLRELEYFVDEQRIGPYRFWHHLHRFTPKDNGVFMEDVLDYALPRYVWSIPGSTVYSPADQGYFYLSPANPGSDIQPYLLNN